MQHLSENLEAIIKRVSTDHRVYLTVSRNPGSSDFGAVQNLHNFSGTPGIVREEGSKDLPVAR